MKKTSAILLTFLFLLHSLFSTVFATSEYVQRMKELSDDPNYARIQIKAYNIKQDPDTGVISFMSGWRLSESEPADTNLYIIDSQTVFRPERETASTLEDFLNGNAKWIDGFILKSQHPDFSDTQEEEVHFVVVCDFNGSITTPGRIKAFEKLESYNIMSRDNTGSFCPYDFITRAAMAKILMTARNTTKPENPAEFSDVATNHWASNYIGNAQKAGYIKGYEDGTFRPDELITTRQAIKMIVCLLGYEPLAEQKGGYPNGYVDVAHQIGFMKCVEALDLESVCTRQTVAEMMNFALTSPLMMQTYYTKNKETAEYAVFDGHEHEYQSILTYYWDEKPLPAEQE